MAGVRKRSTVLAVAIAIAVTIVLMLLLDELVRSIR
jgi:hypothetical protein